MEHITQFKWIISDFSTITSSNSILISEDFTINGTKAQICLILLNPRSGVCFSFLHQVKVADKNLQSFVPVNIILENLDGQRIGLKTDYKCRLDSKVTSTIENSIRKANLFSEISSHGKCLFVRCEVKCTATNTITTDLNKIYSDKVLEGITIHIGSVMYYVPKQISASRFKAFRHILNVNTSHIKIDKMELKVIPNFINFIYFGEFSNSFEELFPLLDKYQSRDLNDKCKMHFLALTELDDLIRCLMMGFVCKDEGLKRHALNGLKVNYPTQTEIKYFESAK